MINHYNIDRYILESLSSGLSSGGGAVAGVHAPPPGGVSVVVKMVAGQRLVCAREHRCSKED